MQSSIALPEALDVDDLVEMHPFWFSMFTIIIHHDNEH